jgi:hypothetical protein
MTTTYYGATHGDRQDKPRAAGHYGLALDQNGQIARLTTVSDGAMISNADIRALMMLALD